MFHEAFKLFSNLSMIKINPQINHMQKSKYFCWKQAGISWNSSFQCFRKFTFVLSVSCDKPFAFLSILKFGVESFSFESILTFKCTLFLPCFQFPIWIFILKCVLSILKLFCICYIMIYLSSFGRCIMISYIFLCTLCVKNS